MDHESLLRKYIALVIDCEGYDYIPDINRGHKTDVIFTDEEVAEIQRLADESQGESVPRRK